MKIILAALATVTILGLIGCDSPITQSKNQIPPVVEEQEKIVSPVSKKYNPPKPPAGITVQIPTKIKKYQTGTSGTTLLMLNKTLNDLRNGADAIVIGYPTQHFMDRDHRFVPLKESDGTDSPYIDYEWTTGNFRVENILYQKAGINLSTGQGISPGETVGLRYNPNTGVATRTISASCYELKQNSRYLIVVRKGQTNNYAMDNFNLARFNLDGTDTEDEAGAVNGIAFGTKTDKQKLREELTAAYGVTFAVPTTVAPSITSLSPNTAIPGSVGFTLTVTGANFKNGAVVKFGGMDKPTTFLSATSLSATIAAPDIATAGTRPVDRKSVV